MRGVAGFVGYLQRRFGLEVLDYDFTAGQRGTVRMAVPPLPDRLRSLTARCRQTCVRSSELGVRNRELRATWEALRSERMKRVVAVRASRAGLKAARARTAFEARPGGSGHATVAARSLPDDQALVLTRCATEQCRVVEVMDLVGGPVTIGLVGELDISNIDQVTLALDEAMPQAGDLLLELSRLTFMGAEGVWLLTNLARERNGVGRVVLVDPSSPVRRVVELARIDRLPNLTVVPSLP